MLASIPGTLDAFNYLRPSNQLVLLLQKGQEFPAYPIELSNSLDEKIWYARMDKLKKALERYWSWVEKALFAFAFMASVTVPWPIISAVTRYIDTNDSEGSGTLTDSDARLSSSSAAGAPGALTPSSSSSISTATASAARYLLRRAEKQVNGTASSSLADDDGSGSWPGSQSYNDSWSNDLRWAAIGILIGVIAAVWLPWIVLTMRNTRRIRDIIDSFNEEDEKLGSMGALTWSLNKAPAFSNAKILLIGLPPGLTQQPSIFNANAYPPSYGYSAGDAKHVLPDYHDQGYVPPNGDHKQDWYAPPAALSDRQAHVAGEHDEQAPQYFPDQHNVIQSSRHSLQQASSEDLNTIAEADEEADYGRDPNVVQHTDIKGPVEGDTGDRLPRRDSIASSESSLPITRPTRSSSRASRLSGRIL